MNYYEILGVDRSAEPDVIDAAYRAMMRRYHPDRFTGAKDEAERRSKQLNEAYAVLKDAAKRRDYDASLSPVVPDPRRMAPLLPNPLPSKSRGLRIALILVTTSAVGALAFYGLDRTKSAPAAVSIVAARQVPPAQPRKAPEQLAPSPEPDDEKAEADEPDCRGADCQVVTPFGWGGIEAGVTVDSAQAASGLKLRDDGHYTDVSDGSCLAYEVIGGPKNMRMLVEGGVVTTVEVYAEDGQPVFRTERGVKLGDPESAVRAAYKSLKQLPDIYSEPPDKKLFHYEPGGERGIKFDINDGKVSGISVGTTSIEYVEGCL